MRMFSLKKYTANFWKREFKCSHCGNVKMDKLFMEMLQIARQQACIPFAITSGYRCTIGNMKVGGTLYSSHLHGIACDIACTSSADRYKIVFALVMAGFARIGISNTFIHVDLADRLGPLTKPKAIWLY